LQSHLHSYLLRFLTFGFHASSSFGDNHSDSGRIHCNSSNKSAQDAALVPVCAVRNLSPLMHFCCRPCVHYLCDSGNATTRLECRLTTLGTDHFLQGRSYLDPLPTTQITLFPLRPGRSEAITASFSGYNLPHCSSITLNLLQYLVTGSLGP
jgi:hypothetical protein